MAARRPAAPSRVDLALLTAEFPQASVHWRAQGSPVERNGEWKARAVCYLDARDVMDRLDDVCGPGRWQSAFEETPKGRVLCRLGIEVEPGQWVWKSDGAGNTDIEAEKGGISDALKRAAVQWGIGRYLYRLPSPVLRCEVSQGRDGKKPAWRRWLDDPWRKVTSGEYQSTLPDPEPEVVDPTKSLRQQMGPQPEEGEPAPPVPLEAVQGALLSKLELCETREKLDHVLSGVSFNGALDRLMREDRDRWLDVCAKIEERRAAFDPGLDDFIPGLEPEEPTDPLREAGMPGAFQG